MEKTIASICYLLALIVTLTIVPVTVHYRCVRARNQMTTNVRQAMWYCKGAACT